MWTVWIIICCNRQGSSNIKRIFGNSEGEGVKKATICILKESIRPKGRGWSNYKTLSAYMLTLPETALISCSLHRSQNVSDKINFWAFLCFGLKLSQFLLSKHEIVLFIVQFLGHGGWVGFFWGGGSVTIWGRGSAKQWVSRFRVLGSDFRSPEVGSSAVGNYGHLLD